MSGLWLPPGAAHELSDASSGRLPDLGPFVRTNRSLHALGRMTQPLETWAVTQASQGVDPRFVPLAALQSMGSHPIVYLASKTISGIMRRPDLYYVRHSDKKVVRETEAWLWPLLPDLLAAAAHAFEYGAVPVVLDWGREDLRIEVPREQGGVRNKTLVAHTHFVLAMSRDELGTAAKLPADVAARRLRVLEGAGFVERRGLVTRAMRTTQSYALTWDPATVTTTALAERVKDAWIDARVSKKQRPRPQPKPERCEHWDQLRRYVDSNGPRRSQGPVARMIDALVDVLVHADLDDRARSLGLIPNELRYGGALILARTFVTETTQGREWRALDDAELRRCVPPVVRDKLIRADVLQAIGRDHGDYVPALRDKLAAVHKTSTTGAKVDQLNMRVLADELSRANSLAREKARLERELADMRQELVAANEEIVVLRSDRVAAHDALDTVVEGLRDPWPLN